MQTNYWITSDTHFNHIQMMEYCWRPANFEAKIFKWLQEIPSTDILICLWDICIREDQRVHDEFIKPLKCRKMLVKWNHDRKSNNWYLNNWWDFVCNSFELWFENKYILFTHEPDATRTWYQVHWHYHNSDHRWNFKHPKAFLYSPELFKYKPTLLRNLLSMKKEKKEVRTDIEKIDEFNNFMLDKWIFILKEWQVIMNPEKVMHWDYEYTMSDALTEFKNK